MSEDYRFARLMALSILFAFVTMMGVMLYVMEQDRQMALKGYIKRNETNVGTYWIKP